MKSKARDFILIFSLYLQKYGLSFDEEAMREDIKAGLKTETRQAFVAHLLKVMDPLLVLEIAHPEIFAKVRREIIMNDVNDVGRTRLSEVLYCVTDEENGLVHIHLLPAQDLMGKGGAVDFNESMMSGLKRLAEIIKTNERIKKVTTTSPIVAASLDRLEQVGFTIEGEIPPEERRKSSKNETKKVVQAFMARDAFLAKYSV